MKSNRVRSPSERVLEGSAGEVGMGAVSLPGPVRLAAYKGSVSPPSSSHLLFNSMKSELDVLLFSVDQIVLALELVVLRQPRSWQWR